MKAPERVYMVPHPPGTRVLYPHGSPHQGRALPQGGAWIPLDHYWQRRLADDSIRPGTPPAEAAAPADPIKRAPKGERKPIEVST